MTERSDTENVLRQEQPLILAEAREVQMAANSSPTPGTDTQFIANAAVTVSNTAGKRGIVFWLILVAFGSAFCLVSIELVPVQGLGGGMIISVANIVISDLVPLQERGFVTGILALSWALSAAVGPLILADIGQWRWLFYLNLPISGLSLLLVLIFLKLPTPMGTFREKLAKMDWM
ncbi:hypothetical protein C0995_015788 [Termitomyces sp. Mi166|nr:hypothetical protein C0995_015788 [Termitomyces sp. Mi166\